MPTFVALLRGINVGKVKRMPMEELRALLGKVGKAATTRNWATVLKLQALLNEGADPPN